MTLRRWMQIILLGSVAVSLVACSRHKQPTMSSVNEPNMAYNDDAQSSGLGNDDSINDQNDNSAPKKHLASASTSSTKRVYYFDYDSDAVHDADKAAIDANAEKIASRSQSKVMLEGHTDPRGSREYNIGLGERRAKAVAEILTAKGASPSQVRVVSYGAEKLASAGHTETDYQKDRRSVLVYLQQ